MSRILFITANYIGDVYRTTGILRHYISRYPSHKITIACGPTAAPLFNDTPNLEKVINYEKKALSMHRFLLWFKTLPYYWDVVIDLRRSWNAKLLFKKQYIGSLTKKTEVVLKYPPYVYVNSDTEQFALKSVPKNKTFAVSITTTKRAKEWPLEKMIHLIRRLTSKNGLCYKWRILIPHAPHEISRIQPFINELEHIQFITVDCLLKTIACLRRCTFFVGNDSAHMHMAASVGIPTIALFGPTRSEHYKPVGEKVYLVKSPISPDCLLQSVDNYETTEESLMRDISVDMVENTIVNILAKDAIHKRTA